MAPRGATDLRAGTEDRWVETTDGAEQGVPRPADCSPKRAVELKRDHGRTEAARSRPPLFPYGEGRR
jgi:hypothetical protein